MVSAIVSLVTVILFCPILAAGPIAPQSFSAESVQNESAGPPAPAALTSETPHSASSFVNSIGVNAHINYFDLLYGNFRLVEHELRSLGVLHVRDGIHLQGSDYNAMLYGRWIELGKAGVRFDAVADPRSKLGPMNSALLNHVDALAGGTIESFEGPNEMDISQMNDWASVDRSYQLALYSADKASATTNSVAVIGPSLALAWKSSELGDLAPEMDYGNLHPYPAGKMPSAVFPQQIDLERVVCEDKPIIITETGYHNAIHEEHQQPGVSEAAAAKYIPRLYLENYLHGIVRTYLYELMDEGGEPGMTDPEKHWGLVRADGSEKPAFFALKNLISEVGDANAPASLAPLAFALIAQAPQIHHLLLQKSSGTYDLVLWQEVPSYDLRSHTDIENAAVPATLTLARQARRISVYQPVTEGSAMQTSTNTQSVALAISDAPVVVEISF